MDVQDVLLDQFLSETGRNSKRGRPVNQATGRFCFATVRFCDRGTRPWRAAVFLVVYSI